MDWLLIKLSLDLINQKRMLWTLQVNSRPVWWKPMIRINIDPMENLKKELCWKNFKLHLTCVICPQLIEYGWNSINFNRQITSVKNVSYSISSIESIPSWKKKELNWKHIQYRFLGRVDWFRTSWMMVLSRIKEEMGNGQVTRSIVSIVADHPDQRWLDPTFRKKNFVEKIHSYDSMSKWMGLSELIRWNRSLVTRRRRRRLVTRFEFREESLRILKWWNGKNVDKIDTRGS